jgi:hypothetical protein
MDFSTGQYDRKSEMKDSLWGKPPVSNLKKLFTDLDYDETDYATDSQPNSHDLHKPYF